MAHAWMVRTFVKHSPEVEEFPELMGIVRAVFDTSRALETRVSDPPAFLNMLRKKIGKLRAAADQFRHDAALASTHTNFQQAVLSIVYCIDQLKQGLDAAAILTTRPSSTSAFETGDMFLGIEIGGTKLQLGVGTGNGSPFAGFRRLDVDPTGGAEGIRRQIEEAGRELLSQFPVRGAAYGFGGPINGSAGIVTTSHQVAGWDNFPLVDWTVEKLGVPTFLGNDCDMAALAEARFGAGREKSSVFYVTVGTGVGGGLVIDGALYGSHRPAVSEIGHLRPGLDAAEPSQTIESIASGRGIETAIRNALTKSESADPHAADLLRRCGKDLRQISGRMAADAAAEGNSLAQEVIDVACRALGWGIAQVITLLAVEIVVVGGGVALAGEKIFFEPLRQYVRRYVFPPLRDSYAIVPASLGEEVVVHGAVAMAAMIFGDEGGSSTLTEKTNGGDRA
jgi:glucokinase